jgi:hypothetical protein
MRHDLCRKKCAADLDANLSPTFGFLGTRMVMHTRFLELLPVSLLHTLTAST